MNHLNPPLNIIIGHLGKFIEPYIFLFYKKVPFIVGSGSAKEDLLDFGIPGKNITIIPHGLSVTLPSKFPDKERKKTVIYLGALTRDKGIEEAIYVFANLARKNRNYQFWVVGKGNGKYFDYIKSLAGKLGISKNIKFWGYVTEEKKFELLSRAHVLIHTSAREGWGLTVIEAGFVGTPTIGFNVAGLKDSIKQNVNGFLVPYKDVSEMSQKVKKLIDSKSLMRKLTVSSKKYSSQFSWNKSCSQSLSFINDKAKKTILILNWKDIKHPEAGGAERVTLEYARFWVKNGFIVNWFTSSFKGARKEEIIDGVKVVRSGNQIFGVHLAAPFYYWKSGPYDLVIDQFHGIPFFTPLFVRAKKLAFIHEVAKEVWKLNPWPKPFNLAPYIFGSLFEPLIFKIFYTKIPFLTVSESTKNDLLNWGINSKNINIIYNGVNVIKPDPFSEKEERKTAIFLGALTLDKGVEDAIDVFSEIMKYDQNWQFWIVGKGDRKYCNKLKIVSSRLGLDSKIKFWGFVAEAKKFELLARAHIMVNPSIREGWGLVNIEANAMGTPVIAYDVSGSRDSVINNKTGILIKLKDFNLMAKSTLELVNNKTYYDKTRGNCITWANKFSWEKSSAESLALLRKVLRNNY